MNKTELIAKVVETLKDADVKVTKKEMTTYVDTVFDTIKDEMVAGNDVNVAGFGKFTIVERDSRMGRNPQTGEQIEIAASKAPKFKASSTLKAAVKGE